MKITINAAEIATLLDRAPAGLRVLSLDCFDTLLWRNAQAPIDVFAELGIGGTWLRCRAEERARERAKFDGGGEVSIEDIYRNLRPSAAPAEIHAAVLREIEAEARHCFAFAPIVALMRAARAKGLRIVIVSDTYLSETQLRALIQSAAGDEVIGLIDDDLLLVRIWREQGAGPVRTGAGSARGRTGRDPPRRRQSAGRSRRARASSASPPLSSASSTRIARSGFASKRRPRRSSIPRPGSSAPAAQPHRPQLSLRNEEDPVFALGHDVLGPLMHAFARWIESEAEALAEAAGRAPKLVFLLRDGHLPQLVFEAMTGTGPPLPRSAASPRFAPRFTDAAAIRDYLSAQQRHERVTVLARQLGLSREEAEKMGRGGQAAFEKAALAPQTCAQDRRAVGATSRTNCSRTSQRQGVERGDTRDAGRSRL